MTGHAEGHRVHRARIGGRQASGDIVDDGEHVVGVRLLGPVCAAPDLIEECLEGKDARKPVEADAPRARCCPGPRYQVLARTPIGFAFTRLAEDALEDPGAFTFHATAGAPGPRLGG
ncbi:hypothetical protein [Streptomyces sp. NPDC058295]|uniref:hypothetical protein n=1 Tax=Streptomyces sp. NPDC058295 TaxID=3346431 RepID=UPI0036F1749E